MPVAPGSRHNGTEITAHDTAHDGSTGLIRSPSIGEVEDPYSAHFHPGRLGRQPDGVLPVEGLQMSRGFEHRPAMVEEVVSLFAPVPSGVIVDATVGGGGHARAILDNHPRLTVLGIDRDPAAVAAASAALRTYGDRAVVRQARFDRLREVVDETGLAPVTGVLFDLGVSSAQLDEGARGFSYRHDAPLDMRMDPTEERTAADVVNGLSEVELARLLAANGEGRFARRIAAAIVAARPLTTTGQLADVARAAIPAPARRRGGHPAKRVFQAVRIEVNAELEMLERGLDLAIDVLVPGGRCVVLSYHSGEDRLVKEHFANAVSGGCTCPPALPCVCGARQRGRLVGRGTRRPSAAEAEANP
ncbi:MAG TPA: 16S rRNA (cytosine(1402)-N(4))-methyltransferase RsmH, partial [Acidimicrobiales bacterium]|nr:16S rRNA (cytosine(1402)-N(4))-methyltransferase RsmH [Acidimicrobiales bacterium]